VPCGPYRHSQSLLRTSISPKGTPKLVACSYATKTGQLTSVTGNGDGLASPVHCRGCHRLVTPIHNGRCDELATPIYGWGDVHARVAVKEVGRLQFEAHMLHGHHREVLHARRVRDAKAVPDDRVVTCYWAVLQEKRVRIETNFSNLSSALIKDSCGNLATSALSMPCPPDARMASGDWSFLATGKLPY
jgi:hypothetical protein